MFKSIVKILLIVIPIGLILITILFFSQSKSKLDSEGFFRVSAPTTKNEVIYQKRKGYVSDRNVSKLKKIQGVSSANIDFISGGYVDSQ